jgi:acyl-CoA thioester hydrolase
LPPQDRFVAETRFTVRYAETDAMGIVHHSNYIVYFEEGRSAYARQRGTPYSSFERGGHYLLVSEVTLRYGKPARYEQELIVYTWLEAMKSRGLTFAYEITDAASGEVLVTGQTKHICVTHDGKVSRIPEAWRAWGETAASTDSSNRD